MRAMHNDPTAMLRAMREQLVANQREVAAVTATTERLLTNGRTTLEQGRRLIAWFARLERSGWLPVRSIPAGTGFPLQPSASGPEPQAVNSQHASG
jgi:hypothetical protein